ncbi:MAG: hypothetical protein ACREVH_01575 [Gammaproteobacteria bacterium]
MKMPIAMAARFVNRAERTLRRWRSRGFIPAELTDADLPLLREVSKAQPVRGRPRKKQ